MQLLVVRGAIACFSEILQELSVFKGCTVEAHFEVLAELVVNNVYAVNPTVFQLIEYMLINTDNLRAVQRVKAATRRQVRIRIYEEFVSCCVHVPEPG